MWKGLRSVFDGQIKGCCFHWSQEVWRKAQELRLCQSYSNDEGTYKFIKKVFALPFLPVEHISAAFVELMAQMTTFVLVDLMDYIQHNWLCSHV
ncbi:hypothetical protein LSAT2_009093, partial [Lamellibrachia satsuma]